MLVPILSVIAGYIFIGFANLAFCNTAETWRNKLFAWPTYIPYWARKIKIASKRSEESD